MNTNTILKGMRTWVIFVNDPTLIDLSMNIYTDEAGEKGKLLTSSTNSLTKAQMITDTNGVKEIYFNFDDFPMDADIEYQFGLTGTGPSFTASSYIAWMVAYPDPVYRTGLTVNFHLITTAPFVMYFIGAEY